MRVAKLATVSNFECSIALCVGVTGDSVIRLFLLSFLVVRFWRTMPLIWTTPENILRKKMRLTEPAAVFKSERLKPPYVGVT